MVQSRSKKMEARFDRLEEMFRAMGETMHRFDARLDSIENRDPNHRESSPIGGSPGTRSGGVREPWRKLELPIFRGVDALQWIERIEQFFLLRSVPEEEWLAVASFAMEGRALTWLRWWEATAPSQQWQLFRAALLRRFQPDAMDNPFQTLLKLRQTTSVMAYRDQFELLAGPLRGFDRSFLTGLFMNGLKPEIGEECKLFSFQSVEELMELAQKVETRNIALRVGPSRGAVKPASSFLSTPKPGSSFSSSNTGENKSTTPIPDTGKRSNLRHLSNDEYQQKRSKGECFFCDEPYSAEHICKNKEFKLLIMEPDEEDLRLQSEAIIETEETLELKYMGAVSCHRSIRAWAMVKGHRVRVLIDCGASDNFINPEIAAELGLEVITTPKFKVKVADRRCCTGQGRCRDVSLSFNELTIREDFFLFPVEDAEFVLGLAWLDTLGEVMANFKESRLRIRVGNELLTVQGAPELCYESLHLQSAVLSMQEGGEAFMVQLLPLALKSATVCSVP